MTAVSSGPRRASRASSARRCVSSRARQSPRAGFDGDLVGPERRDDEQPRVREAPGERREDLEAEVVGPVQVLEGQERRLGRGIREGVHEVEHEHPPPLRAALRPVVVRLGEALQRGSRRQYASAGTRRIDRARSTRIASGTSWSCGARPPIADPEAEARGEARHRPQQAGLADARRRP